MTAETFIDVIKIVVKRDTTSGVIENLIKPPGRQPSENLVELSVWYNKQNDETKGMIKKIISYSVDSSIFHFLCVLDGVAAIESTEDKGTLELRYIKGNENVLLNSEGDLHDLYKAE